MLREATIDAQIEHDNVALLVGWLALMSMPAASILLTMVLP